MTAPEGPIDAIKSAVKSAVALAREGRWEDFYARYTQLFQSEAFAQNRSEDQRQALKLMILTKGLPPPTTEQGVQAYQAAWYALSRLIEQHHDPRDYELLGLVHLRLEDEDGARKVFQAGLELARTASDSDLCGAFLRHLSTL